MLSSRICLNDWGMSSVILFLPVTARSNMHSTLLPLQVSFACCLSVSDIAEIISSTKIGVKLFPLNVSYDVPSRYLNRESAFWMRPERSITILEERFQFDRKQTIPSI